MVAVEDILLDERDHTAAAKETKKEAKTPSRQGLLQRFSLVMKHTAHNFVKTLSALWHKCVYLFSNWWLLEILSLMISIASLTVLMTTLKHWDGQYPGDWTHGVTLNTLIVILSTVSRITMLLPATSAIGQIRWLYFRKPRSLFHFQVLDAASRGPWGSVTMILRIRSPVAIGCAIVITVAVAFESFTQQSLKVLTPSYVPVLTTFFNSTQASHLKNDGTLSTEDFASGIAAALDPDSWPNYFTALLYDPGGGGTDLASAPANVLDTCEECYGDQADGYTCICDTPPYATINICSSCEDLSDSLSENWYDNDTQCIASLPNGVRLDSAHDALVLSARDYADDIPKNMTMLAQFDFIGLYLAEYLVIHYNGSLPTTRTQYGFNAGACSMWLCGTVNKLLYFPASPNNGDGDGTPEAYVEARLATINRTSTVGSSSLLHPTETNIKIAIPNGTSLTNYDIGDDTGELLHGLLKTREWNSTMPPLSIPFSVVLELRAYLFSMFNVTELQSQALELNTTTLTGYFQRQAGRGIWTFFVQALSSSDNPSQFVQFFQIVKIQMSNWLRTWLGGNAPNGYDSNIYPDYLHIRWEWMILPWVLEAMTLALVTYTIWLTHRTGAPVWKANVLASMLHGIDHFEDATAENTRDVTDMEALAKKNTVQLNSTTQGYQLVKATKKIM